MALLSTPPNSAHLGFRLERIGQESYPVDEPDKQVEKR